MVWTPTGSLVVTEEFQTSLALNAFASPFYRLDFDTQFPSRHRLLMGYAKDLSLAETLIVDLVYPSPFPVVLSPQLPSIWNGEFCFFVRSLKWGDSLPSLQINFFVDV